MMPISCGIFPQCCKFAREEERRGDDLESPAKNSMAGCIACFSGNMDTFKPAAYARG